MEYEINICTEDKLGTIKKLAPELIKGNCYIFFDEPWAEIMVRSDDYDFLSGIADMADCRIVKRYDEKSDIEGFGEQYWGDIKLLFQTATRIGLSKLLDKKRSKGLLMPSKIIHCILNNLGYSRWDEFETYAVFANRAFYLALAEDKGLLKREDMLPIKLRKARRLGLYKL